LSDYTNPQKIHDELEYAVAIIRRAGFQIVDVTDKPIESIADEIIRLISARFKVRGREG
jgi:[pyruvate, water dikinase]-phosphate phosphotransferase / [pyruvate, water dikinase] kinase